MKDLECLDCLRNFPSPEDLDHHDCNPLCTHLECEEKRKDSDTQKIKCSQCTRYFLCRFRLKEHMRKIHDSQTFQCTVCQEKFSHSWKLNEHHRFVHERIGYSCDNCNKLFQRKVSISNHVMKKYFIFW